MSHNVAALYIRASNTLTPSRVIAEIERYWLARGAERDARDPTRLEPLSLCDTGRLGFAVSDVRKRFIAIYDSERYTADPELAQHLARELGETWLVSLEGATDSAQLRCFGAAHKSIKSYDAVEAFWENTFPYAFIHFDAWREPPQRERAGFELFAFKSIPPRPRKEYSGASREARALAEQVASLREAVQRSDRRGFLALARRSRKLDRAACDELGEAPLDTPKQRRFVIDVADYVFAHASRLDLAILLLRAQVLSNDGKGMTATVKRLPDTKSVGQALFELSYQLDADKSVGVLELALQRKHVPLEVYNNLLCQLFPRPKLPPRKVLDRLLSGASAVAPKNPHIFHSAACMYVRLGEIERALDMVEGAAKYRYEHLKLLRQDKDLKLLWKLPRFRASFAK